MNDFEARLNAVDQTLFQYVTSQTTPGDKRSLLGLQRAVREANRPEGYVYLEIGSYLGGSLQTHVSDPLCRKVLSIDSRPASLPDIRGQLSYAENTTENMLRGLGRIPGADLGKVLTFEQSTDRLSPASIPTRPHLCFVDGEHTDGAVVRDSRFCQSVLEGNGWIAYHDANIIYGGLLEFISDLQKEGADFRAYNFEDSIFLIELGHCLLSQTPLMAELRLLSARGYLWSMRENDLYRRFYNRRVCQLFRAAEVRIWNRFRQPRPNTAL